MNKNEHLVLQAIDYTDQAHGVCKHEGFVIFVPNMMIGEEAEVILVKVAAKHAFGRLHKLIKAHPDRVVPVCPIADKCGGCQIQHMSYAQQLSFKKHHVQALLDRNLSELNIKVSEIIGQENPYHYRNKTIVPYDAVKNQFGFYRSHSHDIVAFEECLIQKEIANQILNHIKAFYEKQPAYNSAIKHVMIREGIKSKEVMVVFIVRSRDIPYLEALVESISENFSSVVSIQLNYNPKEDNVLLTKDFELLYGKESIQDTLLDLEFEISASSFYQINPIQTEILYSKALELAKITQKDTVLDLYSGIGTIALLAAQKAKKVIGVEVVEASIENAKQNAVRNKIENVEWMCADAKEAFNDIKAKVNVLVVDPPRKGLSTETLLNIVELNPERMIYISCEPSTLVRDLKVLSETYSIDHVLSVDMFGQTTHVETVVLMSRVDK